ncbi:MAG TPA: DUF488 domain-containing protein [Ktedonobacteraceae bacterium]|nr:DUF488 domain-containing protein [Ktedonobacteraceae bacterium]
MGEQMLNIALKRAYDEPAADDGTRVLVDRLWPRGLSKERARIDLWLKEVAPSAELRKWYGHDPEKFEEFRRRYESELATEPARSEINKLRELAAQGRVTLIFATHDAEHSNAAVLRGYLSRHD